jgi:uncharacterized protein YjbI with pentapeptide repeats
MILRDFAQAVSDLGLVLILTVLLLAGLFFAGWWLKRRAHKLHILAESMARNPGNPASQEYAARLSYSANFRQGISTELFGAVITTLAFGVVLLVFQQFQSIQNRKAELILQMGSPDNAFAIEAVRQLKVLGWLADGTLEGADLRGANLQGAEFGSANLEGANLWRANLQGANLFGVNLEGADLLSAKLQGADLWSANLQGANLRGADLQGADLTFANLQSADLWSANLRDARFLQKASFSDRTVLPDSTSSLIFYWMPGTDMTRYTDPNHPDFWQPFWVEEQAP